MALDRKALNMLFNNDEFMQESGFTQTLVIASFMWMVNSYEPVLLFIIFTSRKFNSLLLF